MSSGTKIIALAGAAAVICVLAAAIILLNQDDDPDLSGNWTVYDLDGTSDSGMESFTESGNCKIVFGYHDKDNRRYQMVEIGSSVRTYTELGKKAWMPTNGLYWAPEFGSMERIGHESIPTAAGEKECDILKETVGIGETRTYWVDEDGWAYRIVHEDNSPTKEMVYTYTFVESGHESIKAGYTLTAVTGDGVSVKGNKGTYAMGEYAELEAGYNDEKGFGGWYDAEWNLLGTDAEIRVMVTMDTVIYAVNGLGWDIEPNLGERIDLRKALGADADNFVIDDIDTGARDSSDGTYVFQEGGQYRIYASRDGVTEKVFDALVDSSVAREFSWTYDGESYTLRLDIDYSDVQYARGYYSPQERTAERPEHERDRTFVTMSYTDPHMAAYTEAVASSLMDSYRASHGGIDEYGFLDFLLVFTQNIEYANDLDSTGYEEYWKFPLETLFDGCGDCEDTSILFVAIAHQCRAVLGSDYRLSLQLMPGHASAGVILSSPTGYPKNPDGFIYGETTATGYDLGEIPDKVEDYFLDAEGKYYPSVSTTVEIARGQSRGDVREPFRGAGWHLRIQSTVIVPKLMESAEKMRYPMFYDWIYAGKRSERVALFYMVKLSPVRCATTSSL
jgi:hypothetical protein